MKLQKRGAGKALWTWCGRILLLCALAVLCVSLASGSGSRDWQSDSEALVWGRIEVAREKGLFANAMFMYNRDYEPGAAIPEVYAGQTGLQGTCFAVVAKIFGALGLRDSTVQKLLWCINSMCFIVVFGLFCKWIHGEFGGGATLGAASCALLSPWVVKSTPNLYWVTWTMLLPTVITAFWARSCAEGKGGGSRFGIALFLAIAVRFMCGFEFTSTIMLSSELPVLYYMIRRWNEPGERGMWFKHMVWIGLIELAAFVLAVGVLFVQLYVYEQGDVQAMVAEFMVRVTKRTGFMANRVEVPEIYSQSMNAGVLSVVRTYLFSGEKLYLVLSLASLTLLTSCAMLVRDRLAGERLSGTLIQIALLGACLLPAVSWFVLAKGHSYIHTNICYILFFFPFLPVAVGLLWKSTYEVVCALRSRRNDV